MPDGELFILCIYFILFLLREKDELRTGNHTDAPPAPCIAHNKNTLKAEVEKQITTINDLFFKISQGP